MYLDEEETIRPITAFLYSLLATGRLLQFDVEAAVRLVEALNGTSINDLYYDANLLFYARALAERLVVPLCEHQGPHAEAEWSEGPVH